MQRQTLCRGRKFDFERVTYRTADGASHSLEMVRHPGAVLVLGVLEDGRVTLIRNLRPAVGETIWEAPAGTREAGEGAETCARRELIEEAGFEAGAIDPLATFYTTPGMTDERMDAFAATDLRAVGQRLEAGEQIEVRIVSGGEALAMIDSGELMDGKTIIALLTAERRGLISRRPEPRID